MVIPVTFKMCDLIQFHLLKQDKENLTINISTPLLYSLFTPHQTYMQPYTNLKMVTSFQKQFSCDSFF
jgi:hypothetical protein